MPTQNHPLAQLARRARLNDVAPYLEAVVGEREHDVEWWIEDHFDLEFRAGGKVLVPATHLAATADLDEPTLRTILADFGVTPDQRLTIWRSSVGGMATLPADLAGRCLLAFWSYSIDDFFVCAPPADWALFLYHEGQFSAGRADPSFVARASAEDCRRANEWPPVDDRVPAADRQQEIRTALAANRQAGRSPCSGVVIQTRGELDWLKEQELKSRPQDGAYAQLKRHPDLRKAIMRDANLDDVFLAACYLSEADFSGANLTNAKFHLADAHGANFTGATLYRARCYRANLAQATLRGACLNRADLRKADLTAADFTGARLQATQVSAKSASQIMRTATDIDRLWIWAVDED